MPFKGSCHCGATTFAVDEKPDTATFCTCSICSKRGGLWVYYAPDMVRMEIADGSDNIYRWRTRMVEHHFCNVCGCSTFSRSPDFSSGKPDREHRRIGLNVRLFDDFDPANVPIERIDGKNLW